MAVKAVFAAAAALATVIAMLLPVPHAREGRSDATSQIETIEIGRG